MSVKILTNIPGPKSLELARRRSNSVAQGHGTVCNIYIEKIKKKSETKHVIDPKNDLFQEIKEYPERFEPGYKPLLSDEAVLSFEKGAGIRLSHYNLLVNANGLQKAMRINSRTRIHCDLSVGSMCWVTFQAILPIYCGCIYDPIKPELTIGTSGNDYNLRKDIENIEQFLDNEIVYWTNTHASIRV